MIYDHRAAYTGTLEADSDVCNKTSCKRCGHRGIRLRPQYETDRETIDVVTMLELKDLGVIFDSELNFVQRRTEKKN